jgi:two-component system CheB/CheR fusion protein
MSDQTQAPAQTLDPAATDETNAHARDGAQKRRDPKEPAAVVGLGASAGGIAVLQQFFADIPPDTGLAFVVVMHLSPEHESRLANILQTKTQMPVVQVAEPLKVQPNHVYVIPPNKQLTFNDSMLTLVDPQQALGRRVTIDLFFRTLAQSFGQRSVGVILSGTDSDGVIGLKHVRAQGGVTIAQDPKEAEYPSMPVTAIATGIVDWVLPVAELAPRLVELVRNEHAMRLPPEILEATEPDQKVKEAPGGETVSDETRDGRDESALQEVLTILRRQTGHDFVHYKRATLLRRVARRMQVNSVETIPGYLDFIRQHPSEATELLQDLLISVTHFFRDQAAFGALEANVPQLFAGKRKDDQLRIWVAGCATGEEAYSIAMLLAEHAERLDSPPSIQIFATDIDEQAIHSARSGLYPSTIEADVSPERIRRFFAQDQGRYRVRKSLREKVLFAAHNLLSDAPFSNLDLISCRNLLIYLTPTAQAQVFDIAHFALRAGGLMFIGGSENTSAAQPLFAPVDSKHRLYVRRSVPRPTWKVPMVPRRVDDTARTNVRARLRALPPLTSDGADGAAADTRESSQASQDRRSVLFGELHLKLLEQYAPPSVVVNETFDVVHLSEHAGRYLQFTGGEPTANLPKAIHPALRLELRTALFRAGHTKQSINAAPVTVETDGRTEIITLNVRPIKAEYLDQGFYLVTFARADDAHAANHLAVTSPATASDALTNDLQSEVDSLKRQLAEISEQYELSNEELKASNEELQAMNEEMRSATEELETSKEELQSVNEELVTVNNELKSNVEELSKSNADLTNLMASTDIGTVFLDRQLRIERFTPSAQKIFNLIPADVGRPISDITNKLAYEGLRADAEKVLDALAPIEREVPMSDGWLMVRIAPYRTADDRIAGVVATFVDITRRKSAEDELRESEARLRRAFQIETVSVIFFATDGGITYANPAFLKMAGYDESDVEQGRVRWDTMTPPEFMERSLQAIEEFKATGKTTTYEKQYIRKDGSRFWALFSATKIDDDLGVEFIVDISDRKAIEQALTASEERFRTIADNVPQVIWTNNSTGTAVYFNRRWYDYTGLSYEDSVGPGWQAIVHPDDAAESIASWQEAFANGEVFDAEYRLRGANGEYRWFLGRNVPLRDNGRVLSWFGSATDIHDFKEAQEALAATEEKFRLLVEGAPDYAMFLLDPENNITYWSSGAEKVFGWMPEEALGRKGSMIFTEDDRKNAEDRKELASALREGSAVDRRWHVRKDGTRLWLDGFMRRLNHADGTLRGFAKIAREATEQKMAEEKLRQAHAELEQRVHHRTKELQAMNESLEQEMTGRQQLEKELLEISEREKRRIGEDLHDLICQELTATALFLKSSAKQLGDTNPVAVAKLDEAAHIVNQNVGATRDLARGLQPAELAGGGLRQALRALADQACESTGMKCHVKFSRGLRVTDETIGLHVYRIAQEAVKNTIKHSGAKNVLITLDKDKDHICISVEDDGKGFSPKKRSKGLGLHIMRYRANALGGELKIERRARGGTEVRCKIPLKR